VLPQNLCEEILPENRKEGSYADQTLGTLCGSWALSCPGVRLKLHHLSQIDSHSVAWETRRSLWPLCSIISPIGKNMRVLLLAMPDTADVIDFFGKLPNLGLVNLAGNLPGHEVKVVDLVLYKPRVRRILEGILASFRPELVGLSAIDLPPVVVPSFKLEWGSSQARDFGGA
jgi:hypothetical protein